MDEEKFAKLILKILVLEVKLVINMTFNFLTLNTNTSNYIIIQDLIFS